jgi:hypothetical protein
MFLLIFYALDCSLKFAPSKIRIVSSAALTIVSFRYIALLIFLITKNIRNLYLLKPLLYLNLLCIPVLALVSIYILARNDKIKFDYCMVIAAILMIIYTIAMVKLPVHIEVYKNYGYIMSMHNNKLAYGTYLIINTIFFFGSLSFIGNKNSNKPGMWLVLSSAFITSAELIIAVLGLHIIPAVLFGDILWIITVAFALNKLRK